MTSNYFIIHMLKFCSGKHFCKKKDQLTINAGKVYGERKKKLYLVKVPQMQPQRKVQS